MYCLTLRLVIPALFISLFSNFLVQATDHKQLYHDLKMAKVTEIKTVFLAYKDIRNDLKEAEDTLKKEKYKAEEREALKKAGKYIPAQDFESTLANFNNGYATIQDVFSCQRDMLLGLNKDPLTKTLEEVQLQQCRFAIAGICLVMLLGPPKELTQQKNQ